MMRRISMAARDELVAVVADRYARGDRGGRGRILDEFAAVTGYHRKHAMRLLRAGRVNRRRGPRPGRRIYDEAVREALIVVWEASDRICGKRLRPLLPILVDGAARPSAAGAEGARQITGDERGDNRSGIAGYPAASGNGNPPPVGSFGGDPAQRAGAHV